MLPALEVIIFTTAELGLKRTGDSKNVELSARSLYKFLTCPRMLKMLARLIFATLIGLLLCTLATLEITELLRLADDASNDVSLRNVQKNVASIALG
jgi:hypothetical protein